MNRLGPRIGGAGVVRRVSRPFAFLLLIILLVGASELSAAVATEFHAAQEAELTRLLNDERARRGLPRLATSDALRTIARRQSQRMAMRGNIFHNQRLREDIESVFPDWSSLAENVGVGPSVPSVHNAFMASPGHRANILDPDFRWLGVGITSGGDRLFMTENFLSLFKGASRPLPAQFRLSGATRIGTARILADFGFAPGSAAGAVLAPAYDFHGALAGASLAGAKRGPIVLSDTDRLADEAAQALRRALGNDRSGKTVYAVGGPFASRVIDAVAGLGVKVKVLGGADHARTSADVARYLRSGQRTAFVTTVTDYPDALSVSAVAALKGWPVLYTDPESLSPSTAKVIRELGINATVVVGGPNAVSKRVGAQLAGLGAPAVERLAGPSRVETSLRVADFALARGLDVGHPQIATAENYPDALAGGAVGAVVRSPVLLTPGARLHPAVATWLRRHRRGIDGVYLLGGPNALSPSVGADIDSALR